MKYTSPLIFILLTVMHQKLLFNFPVHLTVCKHITGLNYINNHDNECNKEMK